MGQGQLARRAVAADGRSGADRGIVTHGHRGDKLGVGADKDAVAEGGLKFIRSIVVTGDGAGTDVAIAADDRIAQVGEMIGLGAFAQHGFFGFDKITNMDIIAQYGAWPQTGIRADGGALADFGAVEMRERLHDDIVAEFAV